MEKFTASTIDFLTFTASDILTDKILNIAKTYQYRKNVSNQVSISDLFYDEELFEWLDNCLTEAKLTIGLPDDISLPITTCWLNKTTKLESHHIHSHANSFLSGIFYLTEHEASPTVFHFSNYWLKDFTNYKFQKSISGYQTKFFPKKSTLILFPSYVNHSVIGMNKNEDRYTIAFNTFLSGEIENGVDRCRLSLKAQSVREKLNET